ncbi:hypothetical protein KAR91_69500 [Candidatus Pacearchaeota archaeon]|nr:hypothetical protein [Candidatus Pacearchaeota archaeon]
MALIEQRVADQIEIVSNFKHIQIREADQIVDDTTGEIKSSRFHRRVIKCGSDVSSETAEIQGIANAVWTDEIKTAWAEHQANQVNQN